MVAAERNDVLPVHGKREHMQQTPVAVGKTRNRPALAHRRACLTGDRLRKTAAVRGERRHRHNADQGQDGQKYGHAALELGNVFLHVESYLLLAMQKLKTKCSLTGIQTFHKAPPKSQSCFPGPFPLAREEKAEKQEVRKLQSTFATAILARFVADFKPNFAKTTGNVLEKLWKNLRLPNSLLGKIEI